MKAATVNSPKQRFAQAQEELSSLTEGSLERLACLRDPDKNRDILSRCRVAYYVQTMEWGGSRAIEVCIAGKPADPVRRVFAKVTHVSEEDGTVFDLYTKTRVRLDCAIPFFLEP